MFEHDLTSNCEEAKTFAICFTIMVKDSGCHGHNKIQSHNVQGLLLLF